MSDLSNYLLAFSDMLGYKRLHWLWLHNCAWGAYDINMFHRVDLPWRLLPSQDNDFGSEDRLFPINDQHFVHVHSACPRVTRKKLDIYRQLVKNNKKVENISQLIKNLFAYFYRVFFDPQMFSTKMKKRDATNKSYCFKKLMWKASHCVGRAIFLFWHWKSWGTVE